MNIITSSYVHLDSRRVMADFDPWLAHDKLQHFLVCAAITAGVAFLAARSKRLYPWSLTLGCFAAITAGIAKEIMDDLHVFESRGASLRDFIADLVGVVVAAVLVWAARRMCTLRILLPTDSTTAIAIVVNN